MHRDHRQWHAEHSSWKDDISRWQAESDDMLAELARLEAAVRKYSSAICCYAEDIDRHDAMLQKHERGIAESIRKGNGMEDQLRFIPAHDDVEARHELQRAAHERIKHHHHAMLRRITELKDTVSVDICTLVGLAGGPPGVLETAKAISSKST
jgi:hypothetical protein